MSTVVMEREPPQRIPSRRQIEIGIGEEAYIEPIKDNAKQATNHDTSSLQDHNTKVCDVKTAAVVRQVPNPNFNDGTEFSCTMGIRAAVTRIS